MAIFTDQLPALFSFSKNPIWLKLRSDNFLAAVPAAAINTITFTGPIAADATIALSWTNGAATMVAKAVPDDSGLQFPAGDGSWAYVQSLLEYFDGNHLLNRDFVITADNGGAHPALVFTARAKGPEYNFTTGGAIANPTPGVSDATLPNFRHHLQLRLADANGDLQLVFSANVPLDVPSAGLTSIDIHEQLHAFLESDRPQFVYAALCPNSVRAYIAIYGQYYGDTPAVRRLYKTDTFYVLKGGLSVQAGATRDVGSQFFPVLDPEQTRCLRLGSKNKLVLKDQPEWLYWVNFSNAPVDVQLEITVYNDDQTTLIFTTGAIISAGPAEKLQFEAGFDQLGIGGRQSVLIRPVYYTARVKGSYGYLSVPYGYVIDYNFQEWARYFVYENSYGGYQTICTVGKRQTEFDRNKDDAQLAVDRGTAALVGAFIEVNITYQDKGTVNIGYRRSSARTTALLRDLFASHHIYLYDNGSLIPVGISTKNLKDAADGTNVYAAAFEYFIRHDEEVYSESPALTDDDINELLGDAGSAPIVPVPGPGGGAINGTIEVLYADSHLSVVAGQLVYTAPYWLTGRPNYQIYSTQLANFLKTGEVAYDVANGAFTILIDQFALEPGEKLIIWPFLTNPDGQ